MNIGIIQGRLSKPTEGFQECPKAWQQEFALLPMLQLSHIEWIITYNNYFSNPILKQPVDTYPISSICCDFIINDQFCDIKFLQKYLYPVCEIAQKNKITRVTIPLLEKSSIFDAEQRNNFINVFKHVIYDFGDLQFLIESDVDINKVQEVLDIKDNIFITYDTGNITSSRIDHAKYIKQLHSKIKCVHIKDRTLDARTVMPGRGDTNFDLIFDNLSQVDYNGYYTLQTCRENNGLERQTVAKHLSIVKAYYEKYF
tara:strand:- start:253 stop:1020 length:768 start_codon:yes stop_codon:yes gene_type:complete